MRQDAGIERGDAPDLITMLRGQIVEQDREVARLRLALQEIFEASRDDGLAAMCNWMRGRAAAALAHIGVDHTFWAARNDGEGHA